MSYLEKYHEWLESSIIDQNTYDELLINQGDYNEIEDRFYKDLNFGTGGLRGIIGAGTNRINNYTVRKATQGLANYINKNANHSSVKSVAIAYDSRHYSDSFALEAALVLAANNIRVYLFDALRPTPELSYAIGHLKCSAGIVITASHNPPEYNGYKVYGPDGGQITFDMAEGIIKEISTINIFNDVKTINKLKAIGEGLLVYIGEEIDNSYLSEVVNLSLRKDIAKIAGDFKIVYTPLHGTGLMPITKALSMLGYKNVNLVKSQVKPDGDFPTVKSPNPEEREAFIEGIKVAENINADILLGTDPDCDRVGVVVENKIGKYQILTGNQIGALLTHYIVSSKEKITKNDTVVKTIVTSDLGAKIAEAHGATVFSTLTGFKYIGEKIKEFEKTGEYDFLFGYEESYGYLAGTFVRDKDAVIASVLIVEMAAYYKSRGMSLLDAIDSIYKEYGYFSDALESYKFEGASGQLKINEAVEKFRDYKKLKEVFEGSEIVEDYQTQIRSFLETKKQEAILLPKENVIKVFFKNQSWFAIRPSGTEPKLKIYYSTCGDIDQIAEERMVSLKSLISDFLSKAWGNE